MKKYKESSLISFGLKKNSEEYTFKKCIEDLDLIFIAKLDKEEKLSVTVIDLLTNDEFRLHLSPKAKGEYVQSVRNEIEKLTESIKNSCAESDLFSMQWQKITCRAAIPHALGVRLAASADGTMDGNGCGCVPGRPRDRRGKTSCRRDSARNAGMCDRKGNLGRWKHGSCDGACRRRYAASLLQGNG